MKETKTKLYLHKVFVLTRVKSDEESDGGGVDGNQADEDVGQEEPDQHQQHNVIYVPVRGLSNMRLHLVEPGACFCFHSPHSSPKDERNFRNGAMEEKT